jgi:hypothetical protein
VKTFVVILNDGSRHKVQADFLVREDLGHLRFYVKPHWYSRRRCVAFFPWILLSCVENEAGDEAFLKDLGVKI